MVEPLGNVQENCMSCHVDDYVEKAKVYAKALGVTLTLTAPPVEEQATPQAAVTTPQKLESESTKQVQKTAPAKTPSQEISIPAGEVIDFNQLLEASEEGTKVNWGNVILLFLIFAVALGFAVMYWYFNREKWQQRRAEAAKRTEDSHQKILQILDSQLKYFKKWHPIWQYWILKSAWTIGIFISFIGDKLNFKSRVKT